MSTRFEPSNIVKFGDVDGSGKFAILDITNDYSAIMYANDGHELWRWTGAADRTRDPRGDLRRRAFCGTSITPGAMRWRTGG